MNAAGHCAMDALGLDDELIKQLLASGFDLELIEEFAQAPDALFIFHHLRSKLRDTSK